MMNRTINVMALAAALALLLIASLANAERVKDLAMLEGARTNQLVGFGLVVGLDGSGDQVTQTPFTLQAARSMLQQFGVNVPTNSNPDQECRRGYGHRDPAALRQARPDPGRDRVLPG